MQSNLNVYRYAPCYAWLFHSSEFLWKSLMILSCTDISLGNLPWGWSRHGNHFLDPSGSPCVENGYSREESRILTKILTLSGHTDMDGRNISLGDLDNNALNYYFRLQTPVQPYSSSRPTSIWKVS
jgi:hypothetical protein